MTSPDPRGAISFAEKVIELLDEGRYTSTYKLAVLLALIDLSLEKTAGSGEPPQTVTTREVAEKVLELYWPHTLPFASRAPAIVLRQNTRGQAEIVTLIMRFKERHAPDPSVPHWDSRIAAPREYESLVRDVEWKLIEMPLPRLQTMGDSPRPFIYEYNWDRDTTRRDVDAYQAGGPMAFDNRLNFKPGVGEFFGQLSGLLRPLIQRRWAAMIAQLNRLEESQLETFLFGAVRIATARVRGGIWEIQGKRCFYCEAPIVDPAQGEVDHFLPWSRYPDDSLDNLVVADKRCNGLKSRSLAAAPHLSRWTRRFAEGFGEGGQLAQLAESAPWHRQLHRTCNVAKAIYPRLPTDARLWLRARDFVPPDMSAIIAALGTCP